SLAFIKGLGFTFAAEVAFAEAQLHPSLADALKNDGRVALLAAQENVPAAETDVDIAARQIFDQIKTSVPDKRSVQIELIGHSRGADVNALVYRMLLSAGYQHVDYTALDGLGTDWTGIGPDGNTVTIGGALTITDIANSIIKGNKYNIEAQFGLAVDPFVVDLLQTYGYVFN